MSSLELSRAKNNLRKRPKNCQELNLFWHETFEVIKQSIPNPGLDGQTYKQLFMERHL